MPQSFIEYSEVTGKTVEHVRYYNDPSGAPEVHIRFADGVSLSLKFLIPLRVEAELYQVRDGDMETVKRYAES